MFSAIFRFGGGDPGVLKAMVAGGHLGMMVVGWLQKYMYVFFLASLPCQGSKQVGLLLFKLPCNRKFPALTCIL